jgi:hypothetical protein
MHVSQIDVMERKCKKLEVGRDLNKTVVMLLSLLYK